MSVILSHTTALEALRSRAAEPLLERGVRAGVSVPDSPPTAAELRGALERCPGLTAPLHVVASRRGGAPAGLAVVHATRVPLPDGSVIRLADDLWCSAPEQVLVQMAPSLTRLELVFLLGELLGTYAIAPDRAEGALRREAPVTSRARVLAHLNALGPVPGTAQVRSRSSSPARTLRHPTRRASRCASGSGRRWADTTCASFP